MTLPKAESALRSKLLYLDAAWWWAPTTGSRYHATGWFKGRAGRTTASSLVTKANFGIWKRLKRGNQEASGIGQNGGCHFEEDLSKFQWCTRDVEAVSKQVRQKVTCSNWGRWLAEREEKGKAVEDFMVVFIPLWADRFTFRDESKYWWMRGSWPQWWVKERSMDSIFPQRDKRWICAAYFGAAVA